MNYKYFLIYFAVINIFGILINCIDKLRAKHKKWRIRENTLWLVGIIGGAAGSYITMISIRHKTKHKSFMIGMPVLMIIQLAIMIYMYLYLHKF